MFAANSHLGASLLEIRAGAGFLRYQIGLFGLKTPNLDPSGCLPISVPVEALDSPLGAISLHFLFGLQHRSLSLVSLQPLSADN